jgi:hypothetical protein
MVKASGWQFKLFGRQFEPYLRVYAGALVVWAGLSFPNQNTSIPIYFLCMRGEFCQYILSLRCFFAVPLPVG